MKCVPLKTIMSEPMEEFIDAYSTLDPEPPLRFETGSGSHYWWPDVVAHMAWHRRMTDYYRRNVMGHHHSDE